MSLSTDRIRLRSLEMEDADLLYQWENRLDAWASSGTLNPLSRLFMKDYIIHSATDLVTNGRISLGIEKLEDGLVGYVQLSDYNPVDRKVAIGIYIDEAFRRVGLAKESITIVEHYAQNKLNCRSIYAQILESNEASCRLFASLGYEHIATLPSWMWVDGAYQDLRYYQKWIN